MKALFFSSFLKQTTGLGGVTVPIVRTLDHQDGVAVFDGVNPCPGAVCPAMAEGAYREGSGNPVASATRTQTGGTKEYQGTGPGELAPGNSLGN